MSNILFEVLMSATGCSSGVAQIVTPFLNVAMAKFGIDTPMRQAHFIAQTAFESALYTRTQENLNYSAQGLVDTFPRYFAPTPGMPNVAFYEHQPAKIANHVYANRMGNGDESSGDGFRYRGRGFIMLTGRGAYQRCAIDLPLAAVTAPDTLCTAEGASDSSGWFWKVNNINFAADKNSVLAVTLKINGGTNGIEQRTTLTRRALFALDVH